MNSIPPCKNIFYHPDLPLTAQRYTQAWVRLIHQMEQTRAAASGLEPPNQSAR